MTSSPPNRCRIVLIAPAGEERSAFAARLKAAIGAGDVASLIIPANGLAEADFQSFAEAAVPIAQEAGVAAIIAEDTRIAGRTRADGVHVEGGKTVLAEAVENLQPKLIVGAGGAKTRDDALDLGETQPDYIFFGRFGYDNKPEPHQRNLTLARWWSEMIQVPCIVLAGSDIASVEAVAGTGADFVALSAAVFGPSVDPAGAVAEANAILDRTAPRFEA